MYLDETLPGGGGAGHAWCRACKQEIGEGERIVRVHFNTDPNGAREMTGPYHAACSKPFASMARILNVSPWAHR